MGETSMLMRFLLAPTLIILIAASSVYAQGRGAPPGPPPTPKTAAKIDLTGYWVSLVTEDWRYRQFTPPKGDYESVPISAAGKKIADAWDPAKDEGAGEQCKAYGAAGLMRVPKRLHIFWQDDNTLQLETDARGQTRIFQVGTLRVDGVDCQRISSASCVYPQAPVQP